MSLVLFLGLAVLQPVAAGTGTPIESAQPTEVSEVEGSGIAGKLACFGCAGAIVGMSGGSIGGAILMGSLYPGFFGGCAYLCYDAFS